MGLVGLHAVRLLRRIARQTRVDAPRHLALGNARLQIVQRDIKDTNLAKVPILKRPQPRAHQRRLRFTLHQQRAQGRQRLTLLAEVRFRRTLL